MLQGMNLTDILLLIPAILIGFTVHEFSHAALAVRLGDSTPVEQGRYTLNPLSHIDIIGFLLILVAGFGWAKPVQFDPARFAHPRRGRALVAVAGPLSNLLLALLAAVLIGLTGAGSRAAVSGTAAGTGALSALGLRAALYFIWINLMLFVLNLLPIPPLDGSHIVLSWLPERYARFRSVYVRYGALVLIVLILGGSLLGRDLLPISRITAILFRNLMRFLGL